MFSHQFQIFMRVVECGSFSKAAKIVYITPASVMKHINSLEDRLGVILFERNSRGVTVTSAGNYIYNNCKNIVNEANEIIKNAQNIQKEEITTIKIGSSFLNEMQFGPFYQLMNTHFQVLIPQSYIQQLLPLVFDYFQYSDKRQ